jgi:hypothetical protein
MYQFENDHPDFVVREGLFSSLTWRGSHLTTPLR